MKTREKNRKVVANADLKKTFFESFKRTTCDWHMKLLVARILNVSYEYCV